MLLPIMASAFLAYEYFVFFYQKNYFERRKDTYSLKNEFNYRKVQRRKQKACKFYHLETLL